MSRVDNVDKGGQVLSTLKPYINTGFFGYFRLKWTLSKGCKSENVFSKNHFQNRKKVSTLLFLVLNNNINKYIYIYYKYLGSHICEFEGGQKVSTLVHPEIGVNYV